MIEAAGKAPAVESQGARIFMAHDTAIITAFVASFCLALLFGALAHRVRLSPLAGYLLAGVLIGPFTPGYVADQEIIPAFAEIGVILLMFGVGLHFSYQDLLSVRGLAVPGGLGQIVAVTLAGFGIAVALGIKTGAALVFGLALSVASTVVVLRTLQERRILSSDLGHVAVGWLVVQDFAMVLVLVLLPPLAPLLQSEPSVGVVRGWVALAAIAATLGKVAAFGILMVAGGRRLIPKLLQMMANTGSRELFGLAVLAIALGVALAASALFDVSFALGAFFAGMILAESKLSQRAAEQILPMRDAFAVLFFVSVGMLFDPHILLRQPLMILATLAIVMACNVVAVTGLLKVLGESWRTALVLGLALSQIGEFSFILAGLGVDLKLMPTEVRDLVLAGAILSIIFNPLLFGLLDRFLPLPPEPREAVKHIDPALALMTNHTIIVGGGRVGSNVARALASRSQPYVVVDERPDKVAALRGEGLTVADANGADEGLFAALNLAGARWFVSAIPHAFESGDIVQRVRALRPDIPILARAHSDDEVKHLRGLGADHVIMGEREIAHGMIAEMRRGTAIGRTGD